MAVEVEAGSQIEEFLRVLRKRIWWIIVPASLSIAIATCFGIIVPKKYVVQTRVMVRDTLANIPGGSRTANSAREALVASHEILSVSRVKAVLNELRWPEYLGMSASDQHDFQQKQKSRVSVVTPKMADQGQQVVRLAYSHTEPARAVQFLRLLRNKWQEEVLERGRRAEQNAYNQLNTDVQTMEDERNELMRELVDIRTNYNIVPQRQQRYGVTTTRDSVIEQLNEKKFQRDELEREIERAERDLGVKVELMNKLPKTVKKTEEEESVQFRKPIQENREQILALQQLREDRGYKPRHPKYKEIQNKIAALQEEIRFLSDSQVRGSTTEVYVPNAKLEEVRLEVEADMRALQNLRDDFKTMGTDIAELEAASRELQAAHGRIEAIESQLGQLELSLADTERRFNQKKSTVQYLEGPGGDPFEILEAITEPADPTEPNPILIVIFGVFVGLGLGLALAVVAEYSKNCFRSVHDISRIMVVPVLGTINGIATRREARRLLAMRVVLGGAAFMLIAILGYVTWAYKVSPNLLSNEVLETIESFRSYFK